MIALLLILVSANSVMAESRKIVIAHRGASGYLPEHSMSAKAMAYGMGVDYIEQDLVMTKDNHLVVLHDHYLDRVTDVAKRFPQRKRADQRYYAIDFTLEEIRGLEMTEGFRIKYGKQVPNFPSRFPIWKSSFRVHTFSEEIEMIQGLNRSMGKSVGIYPEIKSPSFHRHEGKDISKKVLGTLKQYGYRTKNDPVYLQSFDHDEIKRIHNELFPEFGVSLKLVQLIAETRWKVTMVYDGVETRPYDYHWMLQPGAMQELAKYVDAIGPWKNMLAAKSSTKNNLILTGMVREAHEVGLKVHPYTFRLDQGRIPGYATNFNDLLEIFYFRIGVDGVFTDFPDRAVEFLKNRKP